MFRLLYGALFVGLLAAGVPAADDDTITLKDHKSKVGERERQTEEERTITRTVIVRDGKREDKLDKKSKVVVYVAETLAVKAGEKKPVKVQRTYEKAEETGEEAVSFELASRKLADSNGDAKCFSVSGCGVVASGSIGGG